jgi:hypothetical protein
MSFVTLGSVPVGGTPLVIGSPVTIDPAQPGYMKQSTAADPPSAASGLVVFEHIQNKSDALTTDYDSLLRLRAPGCLRPDHARTGDEGLVQEHRVEDLPTAARGRRSAS